MRVNVAELPIRTPTASHLLSPAGIALLALLMGACAGPRLAPPQGTATATAVDQPAPAMAGGELFVARATAMLGEPYRYGGAAPSGFDCSGLVVYAARDTGLSLPRTALQLLTVGEGVARDQLRAGDLVFMHLAGKELHVGIALDARRFVHAPSAGGYVRIDLLEREPYARNFFAARRLSFPPTP